MEKQKTIWALTDGRPGNDNQTLAVAEKLGNYQVKPITFSKLASLPNFLLGNTSIGIKTNIAAPYPDIVISAGRKLSRVARIIKKKSGCKIIQLMWPDYGNKDFDLIFTPQHDELKPQPNLVTTYGPPNRITPELLNLEAAKWQSRIPVDSKPVTAVLVGNITVQEAVKLTRILNTTIGYLLITTSRRTPPVVVEYLKGNITKERYLYEWQQGLDNPYLAFLGMADFIIATEDSISMLAESATTGKPLYIFESDVPEKHKIFSRSLFSSFRARSLESSSLQEFSYQKLNTLDDIISTIIKRFEN